MAEYVRRFPVVEVQHTFYEPPNLGTLDPGLGTRD
jgi:uncharacterized protein YecE (DUF72 family)